MTISGDGTTFYGIYIDIIGTTTASSIQNNTIQNISLTGATSNNFFGISAASGRLNIGTTTGNTIGHASTPNSVRTTGNGPLIGISLNGTTVVQVSNNLIANLTQTSSGAGSTLKGIVTSAGTNTISMNTIRDLTPATTDLGNGTSTAIIGIEQLSTTAASVQTVSQNKIYSLISSDAATAVNTIGIYFSGNLTGAHLIERNFIHSFAHASSSVAAVQTGIYAQGGTGTYQNNIIRLGIKPNGTSLTQPMSLCGIYDGSGPNNYYFNTVYVGGSGVTATAIPTYAMNSPITSGTRVIKNNIFVNARSNATTGGKQYAISVGGTAPNSTSCA